MNLIEYKRVLDNHVRAIRVTPETRVELARMTPAKIEETFGESMKFFFVGDYMIMRKHWQEKGDGVLVPDNCYLVCLHGVTVVYSVRDFEHLVETGSLIR